jgi:hypothetical protein
MSGRIRQRHHQELRNGRRQLEGPKAIDPSDGMLRSKLTQAYQAMGALKERDMERAESMEPWESGKDQEFGKRPNYCRDQIDVAGNHQTPPKPKTRRTPVSS